VLHRVSLTIASLSAVFLLLASSALAATRPTVSAPGLAIGPIGGQNLPYVELGSSVQLSIAYSGHLSGGSHLVLMEKDPGKQYRTLKTKLSGTHPKVHVTFNDVGGPVSYKVAVLSGHSQLSTSKPLTVYWAQPPGGVFAELSGDYASYTSSTKPSESCAAPTAASTLCKGDASSGESDRVSGESGTSPVAPGWNLILTFNGQTICSSTSPIDPRCEGEVTFPTVSGETVVPLTATLTSPQGHAIVATRLITVYP
jgi:hypothetical protein